MTPTERAYMQGLIDNMYGQFVQAVADGRHAKTEDIRAIANGKVWSGAAGACHEADRSNGRFPGRG